MTALTLAGIGHAYLGRTVLDNVELAVAPGEVVALVGASGCGKSTLVQIAAGIIEPMRGRTVRSYARQGMVFQEPRLMPWATAVDNIAYPLKLVGVPYGERRGRARAAAARVALAADDLGKFPVALSGGMRQRAAIARALVVEPDFVFFDEPFTALDQALKRRMQDLVIEAATMQAFAALFITHDLIEAVRIAHRIAVLDLNGRGVAGERTLPGVPGMRQDRDIFDEVQSFLHDDPLFCHINDVDERREA
ncbi:MULTISPECIES: ATP-binding cassette domain-containing protein [Bradyrhizobium]|uniref:ABC transporter ATP-binding protein n=1 Tax=Bradyrhizobium TaxID=374 RepID=UPI00040BFB03|nr:MULTISPECIES: ATP-binding cassette domain-containing protein [Bradyrhizobium]KQT13228.1 nitrate/sulfonate/bicarbonate ABC transporter ATP-binding protein [Bradyrhizobium sp. Leaf396]